MQRSNVVSFLAGVVLTATVFYSFGIGGVSDGGQGFIFKRPSGNQSESVVTLDNQRNFDGQMVEKILPKETLPNLPVVPRGQINDDNANDVQPSDEEEAEVDWAAPDQRNASNIINYFNSELVNLDTLHRNYFVKRSWLVTDFCDVSNSDQKRARVQSSLETIDRSLREVRRLSRDAESLSDGRNMDAVRNGVSSISLSLMNLEEIVNGVPERCLSPFWKYAAFPEVSADVMSELRGNGEAHDEWIERIIDLAYTERTRAVDSLTLSEKINQRFADLDAIF